MDKLKQLTGPALVEVYNRMAEKLQLATVRRFADREAGIKRCEQLAQRCELLAIPVSFEAFANGEQNIPDHQISNAALKAAHSEMDEQENKPAVAAVQPETVTPAQPIEAGEPVGQTRGGKPCSLEAKPSIPVGEVLLQEPAETHPTPHAQIQEPEVVATSGSPTTNNGTTIKLPKLAACKCLELFKAREGTIRHRVLQILCANLNKQVAISDVVEAGYGPEGVAAGASAIKMVLKGVQWMIDKHNLNIELRSTNSGKIIFVGLHQTSGKKEGNGPVGVGGGTVQPDTV